MSATSGSHHPATAEAWPELPSLEEWEETLAAVHLWSQVVGKVRLALAPWINHSWGSALYVTTRGLSTSPIHYGGGTFEIEFDFQSHALRIERARLGHGVGFHVGGGFLS